MTARQSTLLRWTEAAEAAEICAYVELEREPQPAAVRRVEVAGAVPVGGRRALLAALCRAVRRARVEK